MRFLVEISNQAGMIHEIETEHGESSPQALRSALAKVDATCQIYHTVKTGMLGRNRVVLVTVSDKGDLRIEVYLRRSGLIG